MSKTRTSFSAACSAGVFALASSVGVAHAGDKPVLAPPGAWVRPIAWRDPVDKLGDAAVRLLLSDQQIRLEPGRTDIYSETVFRVQTPQGLAAGNLAAPWKPDTQSLTVHKLVIRRGAQVIDVLASGQTFTVVRRETNLENAALDGVLTASILPEGLQVGDIVDFAATISSSDPTVKGHVEAFAAAWNVLPIGHAHLRVQWPSTLPVRLREGQGLLAPKPFHEGAVSGVELAMDDVEPLNLPKDAPDRFRRGRVLEATDYGSWADLARLMAPLYARAATLAPTSPLQAEVARLRAASSDPAVRAASALALVEDRVRYVALSLGDGGLVPADADTTWSRRFGDCKGKTVLLLALLHGLGIEADAVVVSVRQGDGLDARLPMIGLLDHVLVRATIGGRVYWLDGTRSGDTRLDALRTPAFGWGLPLTGGSSALVRLTPEPLAVPDMATSIRIDATAGLTVPAPTKIETILRGDAALVWRFTLANAPAEARDRGLRAYWRGRYDFIDVDATETAFDPATGEERLAMTGHARMDWSRGSYELDDAGLGYKADFTRTPGPDREAPFAVSYPSYLSTHETILLPPGFEKTKIAAPDVDRTIAGVAYHRHVAYAASAVDMIATQRSLAPEFPFKDAEAAEASLRELADQSVALNKPEDYRETPKEAAQILAKTPITAEDYRARGAVLVEASRFDEAISAYDHVIALKPQDANAFASRGLSHAWRDDALTATADLDRALGMDPRNVVALRGRGVLAQREGRNADAVARYTEVLAVAPDDLFALAHRAAAARDAGRYELALADAASASKLQPSATEYYILRSTVFMMEGQSRSALKEIAALADIEPGRAYPHVVAAASYAEFGRQDLAMHELDRALAIKPEAYIYLNRYQIRLKADLAGRRLDVDAAYALAPKAPDVLASKAIVLDEGGDHSGAVKMWTAALVIAPGRSSFLAGRGIAYLRSGLPAPAERDFLDARSHATQAVELNELCWAKATAGLALDSALTDCDAALAKAPGVPAYLDSRGMVLLRMNRLDEAIAAYDRALAKSPLLSSSLFGRAVAWSRKGDVAKSAADAAAAEKLQPNVRQEFVDYGVELISPVGRA